MEKQIFSMMESTEPQDDRIFQHQAQGRGHSNSLQPIKGKPIKHRQRETFGCGSYALANLFDEILFELEIEDGGENQQMLNEKMKKYGDQELYLQTLVLTSPKLQHNRIQDHAIFTNEANPAGYFTPYILNVYHPGTDLLHTIAVAHDERPDLFYCLDSRNETVTIYTRTQLFEVFWIVGVDYFGHAKGSSTGVILFEQKNFPHIF